MERPVNLDQISSTIHHGCMGLPQELVENVVEMLLDDSRALKACSLTCKAMFAATRRLIYRKLYLTKRNNESVLTREEADKLHHRRPGYRNVELRFLSLMGERGFLRYAKEVHIRNPGAFTPESLIPHLHYFQSLNQIHTLAIEQYNTFLWANYHETYFIHFYPTLTSLTLSRPLARYRPLMRFALQFPKLDNLCLEWLCDQDWTQEDSDVLPIAGPFPPLRGRLRLALGAAIQWSTHLTHDLRSRANFRSVEIETEFFGTHTQRVLDICAHTLENLTIVSRGTSTYQTPLVEVRVI